MSTVSVGDSFSAALVFGLLNNYSASGTGNLAVAVSDFVVGHPGALPQYDEDLHHEISSICDN